MFLYVTINIVFDKIIARRKDGNWTSYLWCVKWLFGIKNHIFVALKAKFQLINQQFSNETLKNFTAMTTEW